MNKETGEVELSSRDKEFLLTNAIIKETRRPDGSLRIQQDFSHCPSLTEQHTAHLSDLNWLIEKYKPDELAQYIAARAQHRVEILGHDFSQELSLQEAQNVVYQSRKAFEELPDEVRRNFKNHLEFIKFIDNPENVEKMLELGILTKRQVDEVKLEKPAEAPAPAQKEDQKKEQAES